MLWGTSWPLVYRPLVYWPVVYKYCLPWANLFLSQSWNSFLANTIIFYSPVISRFRKSLPVPWGLESGCVFVLPCRLQGVETSLLLLRLHPHPFLGVSLVTCSHFPLDFFPFGPIFISKLKIILSLLSLAWKWFFVSLTETPVEGESEKSFRTFHWPYRKYSVLVKLFRQRSSESPICSCCLSSCLFPQLHKEGQADIFWMNRFRMGECSLHSEANVLIVCILRQRYSHLPCSQSELHIQGKINADPVV